MLRVIIAMYVLCVLIYGVGAYISDHKVDKLKLLKKISIALLVGVTASAIITTFVFLF